MIVKTISLPPSSQRQLLAPTPLSKSTFASFGNVIANPAPDQRPSNTDPTTIASGALPCGAISANQGTAIQYRAIASMRDLYTEGGTKKSTPRMTMFVCAVRDLTKSVGTAKGEIAIKVLERHPFTTQTFIPLTADVSKRYLVVVAPSLSPSPADAGLPVPLADEESLPGRGLPDLNNIRAFIATGEQAVTYGPGTWHAPMIALGPLDSTVDFVVVQFANDVPVEDCQEVALESPARSEITISVPEDLGMGKGARLTKL
ncbi:ureidoglycolate hydrolase [Xylariaceae sp. FL0255]|nr:ureidoglycolate hydrolase [Xylariaceae sp. FL0255]